MPTKYYHKKAKQIKDYNRKALEYNSIPKKNNDIINNKSNDYSNNHYSKHKLYKLRSLKINKYNNI